MGTYYKLINATKREQYEPANGAVKYSNFIYYAEEMLHLLLGRWSGDEVRLVGDYKDLWHQTDDWPKPPIDDYIFTDNERSKVGLDHNGLQKLLEAFVRDLGAEVVAVALDAAIEKAKTE